MLLALAAGCTQSESRQAEVARKGGDVMPFDLDRTTHVFAKRPFGGVQTVLADDPADERQVSLVREHLSKEEAAFSRGDFADPAAIHGHAMPGLESLRAGAGWIDLAYAEVDGGARLTYRTAEPKLVAALHAWFDAQVMDHGEDAEIG